jgi:hypothetical protein
MPACGKIIATRSKYSGPVQRICFKSKGHAGKCEEFPYLRHLVLVAPKVADKIIRDSVMTTGAAWKSEDAGPNRILRWVMLRPDNELAALGINMANLKPQVVAKLREKAADYNSCMSVAQKLTGLAYGMLNAPDPPGEIEQDLADLGVPIARGTTGCLVCRDLLDFGLFAAARRGKAEIETSHSNPRIHTRENVGFAHRACNIAQGNKTVEEFYDWIGGILHRARPIR